MASVHRKFRSPFYYAAFRDSDGTRRISSTKQKDRNKAMGIALELERAAQMARRGELVEAQSRKILIGIMERTGDGETINTVSIRQYINEWLEGKEERKSEGTFLRYEGVVRGFLTSLGNRADRPLTALTSRDIDRFLDARLRKGVSSLTAVLDVKVIRTALNSARRKGLLPTNPAEAVDLPKPSGVERGTFTPAQVQNMLDTSRGEWKTVILFGYYTGARITDCCRMEWGGVILSKGTLTYTQKKTSGKITIPLHEVLLEHLNSIAGTDTLDPFITPSLAGLKTGGNFGTSRGFKRILEAAGIDSQIAKGNGMRRVSKLSFHSLRHSFTSELANAGVSEELRMKLTGHTTRAVHRGYTHHEMEPLRAAIGKTPSLNL